MKSVVFDNVMDFYIGTPVNLVPRETVYLTFGTELSPSCASLTPDYFVQSEMRTAYYIC